MRFTSLLLSLVITGCGDWTIRVPPVAPIGPPIVFEQPFEAADDDGISELFMLNREPGPLSRAAVAPPPVARGRGHLRGIPDGYRQRLGEGVWEDVHGPPDEEPHPGYFHTCGTGLIRR